MTRKPHGAGRSSIDLVDLDPVFEHLIVRPDTTLLDVGCGEGNYVLAAAERLDPEARIVGVDLWSEGVDKLRSEAAGRGFDNIVAVQADAAGPLPLEDGSVDAVLMATVFHDLVRGGAHEGSLREIARVLGPEGRFVVVEFEVRDGPPGPPASSRIGPDKLEEMLGSAGFSRSEHLEVGEHTYMSVFVVRQPFGSRREAPA
jgi:ubiquinone/menaquinone biosynthesis C-methylase UbiE